MGFSERDERLVTTEELMEAGIEINHELAARLIGGRAMEMYALIPEAQPEVEQPTLF